MWRKVVAAICAAVLGSTAAAGASLVYNSDGKIAGVNGVRLAKEWNVRFVEGSCVTLFNGCDDPTDFQPEMIVSVSQGAALMNALNGIGLETGQDLLWSDPSKFYGCEGKLTCMMYIPGATFSIEGLFVGGGLMVGESVMFGVFAFDKQADTKDLPDTTFAIFTEATSVPELSTWLMMIVGFSVVGFAMRSRAPSPGWRGTSRLSIFP